MAERGDSRVRVIEMEEGVLGEDRRLADRIRSRMESLGVCLVNVMASPGAGKTTLLIRLLEELGPEVRFSVMEGDVASSVDTERVIRAGGRAVQIRTGGLCHLSAPMVWKALDEGGWNAGGYGESGDQTAAPSFLFIENVGNLVCPAAHDLGARINLVLLSVPEGDDKPWKYPAVFKMADAVVITKIDYPGYPDYRLEALRERVEFLRPGCPVFPVSAKTGQGMGELVGFLLRTGANFTEQ